MDVIFNPVVISVITLCILCLRKVNVLLAIFISSIVAGLCAKMPITEIMNDFISGMGGNSETALSYILLGAFAATMTHSGLESVLSKKISTVIKGNIYILIGILTCMAIFSQNLIPVHIAFIPIIIPPLIKTMNAMKLDRRLVACALAFGLKAPYIVLPTGFGLIFQGLLADNLTQNGMEIAKSDIWKSTWFLGLAMLVGFAWAMFISYRKPREYSDIPFSSEEITRADTKIQKEHYFILLAAAVTFLVQLWTKSLPLGALVGLGVIFGTGAINYQKMDKVINEGIGLMGYVAFVMLVAAGFAAVLKATGGIDTFVNAILPFMTNKVVAAGLMLLIGLFITIGIGSSFGTIPILAVLFAPICIKLGFSLPATIIVLAAAAALGDAGSPASDTTLGPTSGLNIDAQHNHIWDTCIPTFLHYNIPLLLFAILSVLLF